MNNQNFASTFQFYCQFSYNNDELKFNLTETKLPDVAYGTTSQVKNGSTIYLPGDSKDIGTIPLSFLMDEGFETYIKILELADIYNCVGSATDQFQIFIQNNQNVTIARLDFYDIYFTFVSGPILDTKTDITESIIEVTLNYLDFKIVRM